MHVAEVAPCFEPFGLQTAKWGLSGPNPKSRKFTPQMHLFLMKKQQKNKVNEVSLFMERDFCHCLLAGPGFAQTLVLLVKGEDRRALPSCPPRRRCVSSQCDGRLAQAAPWASAISRIFLALNCCFCEVSSIPPFCPGVDGAFI